MTPQKFAEEQALECARQTRLANYLVSLPKTQLDRLAEERNNLRLGISRVYGDRLADIITDRVVENFALNPECLCSIGGGVRELPQKDNRAGWNALAKRLVDQEPLAKLSIDSSDANLRAQLEAEAVEGLRPERRLALARANELDTYIAQTVDAKLNERAGL